MEVEELVDRYKHTRMAIRGALLAIIALVVPVYIWFSEGDELHQQLESAQMTKAKVETDFKAASEKKAELTELREKKAAIQEQLERAKRYLPDQIEFDELLAQTAQFEKELGATLMRFKPGAEVEPDPNLKYKEVPVEIEVRAGFSEVMAFLDRLVHLEKLAHLRDLNFSLASGENLPPGTVLASGKLILFRGTSEGLASYTPPEPVDAPAGKSKAKSKAKPKG